MSSRKKSKPNPPAATRIGAAAAVSGLAVTLGSAESRSEPNLAVGTRDTLEGADRSVAFGSPPRRGSQADSIDIATKAPRPSQSWYGGSSQRIASSAGSLPSHKSAKDGVKDGVRDSKQEPSTPARKPSSVHLSPATSIRSQAVTATTKLNISTGRSGQSEDIKEAAVIANDKSSVQDPASETSRKENESEIQGPTQSSEGAKKADPQLSQVTALNPRSTDSQSTKIAEARSAQQSQGNWTTWFVRSQAKPEVNTAPTVTVASVQPCPPAPPTEVCMSTEFSTQGETPEQLKNSAVTSNRNGDDTTSASEQRPRSWLGLWTGSKPDTTPSAMTAKTSPVLGSSPPGQTNPDKNSPLPPEPLPNEDTIVKEEQPTTEGSGSGSSWAFWSRSPANASKGNVGELAVAGSSSQSQPQRALGSEDGMPKAVGSVQSRKRGRPHSLEFDEENRNASAPPSAKKTAEVAHTQSTPTSQTRPSSKRDSVEPNNLLLPLFKQTFPYEPEKATIFQQIGQLFYGKPANAKHPTLIRDPPRIKKALAIGVHGYFPTPLVQTVIGRPTGTSIKFAEYTARAIHKYTQSKGYTPASVEKIALEGEGKIEERLDILWKLLLNWIDKIRHADFIILACHSQGVPVAISLAAKLIGFGCVNGARIGVCAMAGVNLGPFADYKSRWIGGSAGELFEFARPDSAVSKSYENSLDTILRFGAKVLYAGSMDDQLVSLQSSTFGSASHPNIYRAVWVDGRLYVADFLTHLVGFALKLRNLGISDHGLIRELSNPLAGSLVGGEGHSRIYEDPAVYDLAIEYTAGTTSIDTDVLQVDRTPSSTSANPYILPFAMRGLLEEEFVRTELAPETLQLIKQFDDWKPTTKVLRDVKYRLEGVRSKL